MDFEKLSNDKLCLEFMQHEFNQRLKYLIYDILKELAVSEYYDRYVLLNTVDNYLYVSNIDILDSFWIDSIKVPLDWERLEVIEATVIFNLNNIVKTGKELYEQYKTVKQKDGVEYNLQINYNFVDVKDLELEYELAYILKLQRKVRVYSSTRVSIWMEDYWGMKKNHTIMVERFNCVVSTTMLFNVREFLQENNDIDLYFCIQGGVYIRDVDFYLNYLLKLTDLDKTLVQKHKIYICDIEVNAELETKKYTQKIWDKKIHKLLDSGISVELCYRE